MKYDRRESISRLLGTVHCSSVGSVKFANQYCFNLRMTRLMNGALEHNLSRIMHVVYESMITNMATVENFEVKSDKLLVVCHSKYLVTMH
jgi:adenosine deaminase